MQICITDILESTVSRLPNQLAIVTEHTSYTYRELNSRVNALAWGLMGLGIEKGDIVACLLPNGVEIIELYFATSRIGAILSPMNPDLKPFEFKRLLVHSSAKALIVDQALEGTINSSIPSELEKLTIIWVGNNSAYYNYIQLIESSPKLRVRNLCNGNDPTTILYTSGTTGNPKGVVRTQANNLWAAISMATYRDYRPEDKELWWTPMFGVGFFNFFLPNIITGCTVYLEKGFDTTKILQSIEAFSIQRLHLVPSLWKVLVNNPQFRYADLSSLRKIIIGSAPVSIETKRAIERTFPTAEVHEFWGMTEGGLIGILPKEVAERPGSIGRPIPFNEAKLIDEHGLEVATGDIGEIAIRGPGVITSYYKNKEIGISPFTKDGWFRTADLARQDNDGFFYLAGRQSDMIISGENKIYPDEIERVLESHPNVQEVALFELEDPIMGEVPVAVVVLKNGESISAQDLIHFLAQYLANYKLPKHIFFTEHLPMTVTGKVAKALLKLDFSNALKA